MIRLHHHWDLLLSLAMILLFFFWPQIDLIVAGWFYNPTEGFFLKTNGFFHLIYALFAYPHLYILPSMLAFLLWSYWRRRKQGRDPRRKVIFLILVLVIGPGLLVNGILKNYSGRARPTQVTQFGGDKVFSPAFVNNHQCEHNCSFVSGHASMGFWFISLAWVFRKRRWLWFGIALGALVSLTRIVQGGHFLSDTVFAFWVVYFTCVLLARFYLGFDSIRKAPPPLDSGSSI